MANVRERIKRFYHYVEDSIFFEIPAHLVVQFPRLDCTYIHLFCDYTGNFQYRSCSNEYFVELGQLDEFLRVERHRLVSEEGSSQDYRIGLFSGGLHYPHRFKKIRPQAGPTPPRLVTHTFRMSS